MNILIGVTGGIASYKICELIRLFKKNYHQVKVVMTQNALEFVGAKTFETLSENPVYINQFETQENVEHIALADWADVFILAPLSANTLSKIANGICDNLLTSVFCAFKKRKILAPAMNDGMYNNPAIVENLKYLKGIGCEIIEPESGFLACGTVGNGRLADISKIYEKCFSNKLSNKKIIITAGGTKEFIDPVRYIGNCSSGKMGVALADCAYALGAEVELITTVDVKRSYKITPVQSAIDMQKAVEKSFPKSDVLIMAAAVSDFRVKNFSKEKISRDNNLTLELVKNTDILKSVAVNKKEQKVVGFCLSTENVIENAKKKLVEKNCDFIVANEAKTALGTDESEIWIVDKTNCTHFRGTKTELAKNILELIYD